MSTAVVDQLVKRWVTGDAAGMVDLCHPDALLDINVPQWRYQIRPAEALPNLQANTEMPDRAVTVGYYEQTNDGGVVEFQIRGAYQGEQVLIRELWTVRTDGDKITEWIMYCTGPWDAATIARQRAEAPMIKKEES